jgi:hypothetical protein
MLKRGQVNPTLIVAGCCQLPIVSYLPAPKLAATAAQGASVRVYVSAIYLSHSGAVAVYPCPCTHRAL